MKKDHYNLVDPRPKVLDAVDMRVQEMIYGHRFSSDQIPYMILLEALAVCNAKPLGDAPMKNGEHEEVYYMQRQGKKLRFLLFLDQNLESVVNDNQISESEKWDVWKNLANDQYQMINRKRKTKAKKVNQFDYLDKEFNRNIHSLAQAVEILKSQELGAPNNRRWTSKFLAVQGPNMVCGDLSASGGPSGDRRFFARGGEIVYLMLNRSSPSQVEKIRNGIEKTFFDTKSPMDQVASAISERERGGTDEGSEIGYLPLADYCTYKNMADDWISILNIKKLPVSHRFDPLFRITGLNLFDYFAKRSNDIIGDKNSVPIVVDVEDGKNARLRDVAKDYFLHHRAVANRAVEEFVKQVLSDTDWEVVVTQNDSKEANEIIWREFNDKNADNANIDPKSQMDALISRAKKRSKNNINKLLAPLAKGIGLVNSRPGIGTWFALSDQMISALVLANVTCTAPVELGNFVRSLYDRYRIVIGPDEAEIEFDNSPPLAVQSFCNNLSAFERRMTRLSFTRRLSDDCAFVVNPYR